VSFSTLMVMRANLRRNKAGIDTYGQPKEPAVWDYVGKEIPCFVWFKSRREVVDGQKIAIVEDIRGVFRSDADVKAGDQIDILADRRGRKIVEGILLVDSTSERTVDAVQAYRDVALRRIRGS